MKPRKILDFLTGSLFPVVFFGGLYLLFFSTNNSCDGLSYAADIRQGVDIFYPHHLLYNAVGYVIARLLSINNTLLLLCVMNALAAAGCLLLTRQILKTFLSEKISTACLWALGACWGFMRFATEAETYIIPLVFSLWGSLAWIRGKNPFSVSLLAALACLFHQIHFFWWLGLGVGMIISGRKDRGVYKEVLWYLFGALIVPVVYLAVWMTVPQDASTFLHYVFHDYFYVDAVGFSFKQALFLTPVNFVRTFFQVHGYIPALLARYPFLAIGIIVTLICFVLEIKVIRKKRRSVKAVEDSETPIPAGFASTHLLVALLQLFFAFLSNGNAEFMVMIPFALLLFIAASRFFTRVSVCGIMLAATGMGAWNICLGLIPYHFMAIQPFPAIEKHIENHSTSVYFVEDYAILYNRLRYYHPSLCNCLKKDFSDMEKLDAEARYTDKIGNKGFVSRASVTQSLDKMPAERENITVLRADTLYFDLGKVVLVQF